MATPFCFSSVKLLKKLPLAAAGTGSEMCENPGALATSSMFFGSSNSIPFCPFGAAASTLPPKPSWPWLDTSTLPPSPPSAPPLALIVPSNSVSCSDQTTAVPPVPLPVALTSSLAADRRVRPALARSVSPPCQPPPTRMRPPLSAPLASSDAPATSSSGAVTAISPPCAPVTLTLPESRASAPASMRTDPPTSLPPSAFTVEAVVCSRCLAAPMAMPPPATVPLASYRPDSTTLVPVTLMVPPRTPFALTLPELTTVLPALTSIRPPPPFAPEASSAPELMTLPPLRRITPPRFSIACAWTMPLLLTTVCNRLPAACAFISTRPPSAWIRPPLSASASSAPLSTVTLSNPSPATSSVIALPAASATVPRRAAITPSLETLAPSIAT